MSSIQDPGPFSEGCGPGSERLELRLYITRGASNSLRALANLKSILEGHFAGCYSLEVIDLLEQPQRAFVDDVLVTPTLIKLSPLPGVRMAGNLSRTETVLEALLGQRGAETHQRG